MGNPPEVTAVVVNWNAGDHLRRCVEVLLSERAHLDLDIVVVDNASSDGSLQALDAFPDGVRLVQTGENLGFGRGVNRGLAASKSPYIAALNPDVALRPGALLRMVHFLEREPSAGLVGPRLYGPDGRMRASCGMPPRLADEVCRKFLLHMVFPFLKFRRRYPRSAEEVGWVTGACFAARRSALEEVEGMDEAIFMYYEDVDLCLRMRQAGWRVVFLPEAEGTHLGGGSSRQVLERMLLVSEASYTYFVGKHLGRTAEVLLSALTPLEMGLRIMLWSALAIAPGHRREARMRLRAYRKMLTQGIGRISSAGPVEGCGVEDTL